MEQKINQDQLLGMALSVLLNGKSLDEMLAQAKAFESASMSPKAINNQKAVG
jgi:hypothetical protein